MQVGGAEGQQKAWKAQRSPARGEQTAWSRLSAREARPASAHLAPLRTESDFLPSAMAKVVGSLAGIIQAWRCPPSRIHPLAQKSVRDAVEKSPKPVHACR